MDRSSTGFAGYGCFRTLLGIDPVTQIVNYEDWHLSENQEWEEWSYLSTDGVSGSYLIYFITPFQGMIFRRNPDMQTFNNAKQDVEALNQTMFTAIECCHILEKVMKVGGIRKSMVKGYMETLASSLITGLEITGMKVLASLTAAATLVHRAAPIHIKLCSIVANECYTKQKS